MRFCHNCGMHARDNANLCTVCGSRLYHYQVPQFHQQGNSREIESRLHPFPIFGIFVLSLLITVAISIPTFLLIFLLFYHGDFDAESIAEFALSAPMLLTFVTIQDLIITFTTYIYLIRPKAITFEEMGLTTKAMYKNIHIGLLFGLILFALFSTTEFLLLSTGYFKKDYFLPTIETLSEYIFVLVATCIIAPLAEELFFRGVAFKGVVKYYKERKNRVLYALIFSSLLFSIVHMSVLTFIPIILGGIVLALLLLKTDSLIACITAHGVNNFIVMTLIYLDIHLY